MHVRWIYLSTFEWMNTGRVTECMQDDYNLNEWILVELLSTSAVSLKSEKDGRNRWNTYWVVCFLCTGSFVLFDGIYPLYKESIFEIISDIQNLKINFDPFNLL